LCHHVLVVVGSHLLVALAWAWGVRTLQAFFFDLRLKRKRPLGKPKGRKESKEPSGEKPQPKPGGPGPPSRRPFRTTFKPALSPPPVCGFRDLGSIGRNQEGLIVIRSMADWDAYAAGSLTCGTVADPAGISGVDFSQEMVTAYLYQRCSSAGDAVRIIGVCITSMAVEVSVEQNSYCGGAWPPPYCFSAVVAAPQSSLPVISSTREFHVLPVGGPGQFPCPQ
jgi:hypothetical protein